MIDRFGLPIGVGSIQTHLLIRVNCTKYTTGQSTIVKKKCGIFMPQNAVINGS